ncbi:MAG: DUF3458 domain-containing protein, partial [Thiotrichaceae bacterium]|nr:DUF3458 domain-containing protein [Thiotrichaceae bacterium]
VLHIPVKVALFNTLGSHITPIVKGITAKDDEVTLELTEQTQTFVFENVSSNPVISILREFSAPVKLEMQRPLSELAFLLQHDNDSFNRWEAGQQLTVVVIFELIEAIKSGQSLTMTGVLIDSFKAILSKPWTDLAYLSCLLSLPAENYLAEQMSVVDVESIHQARQFVKLSLAEQLAEQFHALYAENHLGESGELTANAIARRRIKNVCLDYLSQLETEASYRLLNEQFSTASTMTDQIAALGCIVNSQNPAKSDCLQQFYQQWQDEALVIDKWFSLQASSSQTNTFTVVQSLLQHSAFDLKNPNRVRALVGAFSLANPLHYHAINGQGYQFLADQVIALNSLNPQVASRMVGALTQWRRFDEQRQILMKQQLERIINTENISKDVFEIASKSLI